MLKVMIYVLLATLGLALGSFVNAAVWRLRQQEQVKKPKAKKMGLLSAFSFQSSANKNRYSILTGRSMCPQCKHKLSAKDLIPVISWLELKGKCRYCKKPISWQYPLVELLTAALFVASYALWPYSFQGQSLESGVLFGLWLIILTFLVMLFVYDIRWMELPDKLVLWVTASSVLFVGLLALSEESTQVASSLLSAGLLFALFYLLFQISKGRWIGGGDVKLAPALGLLAGSPLKTMLLLFIASLIGTIIGVPLLIGKKDKRLVKLPFGPLLIVGLLVVFFFGQNIIDWYKSDILYL